ncbi:MAG: type II toxin-antitoxin system HicB family antitoxin [Fimbriimonadales bacterium]|jgi:predicted RNase H-like HicB family nuclease|nr:type II toxin-antitoxin system HicB family antitoxin [Armatimonadota bacterium]MCX7688135.1 type II toxin-antitoxin system HicB family antitoxin [Fimbriimonadales bacterium]CUU36802.1 Predicted nuclease of the RNAse H fold, HicB family [Armatimonadetes bacterium DC]
MLTKYIQKAMERATFEHLPEEGCYYGEIPGFDGVWATGATLEACRAELQEVLEEWILMRVAMHLPVPQIEGIALKVPEPI